MVLPAHRSPPPAPAGDVLKKANGYKDEGESMRLSGGTSHSLYSKDSRKFLGETITDSEKLLQTKVKYENHLTPTSEFRNYRNWPLSGMAVGGSRYK